MLSTPRKVVAFAQNATEVALYGGLRDTVRTSPYRILASWPGVTLRRYFPDHPSGGSPLLLVHPVMMSPEVWDVDPVSAVRRLHEEGVDPWVIDFGRPDVHRKILERTLSELVVTLSSAIDEVIAVTGRSVHVSGYSQGGMLAYQVAALRRSRGIASVISMGSPVDFRGALPRAVSPEVLARAGSLMAAMGPGSPIPGWATRTAFRVVDPVKSIKKEVDFLLALHDRDALLPREGQRRFIDGEGWITAPGPALAEFGEQFLRHNRMLRGGMSIDGAAVSLAEIRCPMLGIAGNSDFVAPIETIRPLAEAAPRSDVWEAQVGAGHLGLVLGSKAQAQTWPAVLEWIQWVDGSGPEPSTAVRMSPAEDKENVQPPTVDADLGRAVATTLARVGFNASKNLVNGVVGASTAARRIAKVQNPKNSPQSLGRVLDEQAAKAPQNVQFLFQDRAVTCEGAKVRIDAVTEGLLQVGVRQGERVGILMAARPSAVAAIAAVNRIGAVSVLLRPGADVPREAELGQVTRVVCDPERVDQALETSVPIYVLGGGPETRPDLPDGVVDLEALEFGTVPLPAWYRPNPGQPDDLAFVLFTGTGRHTRVNLISNRRWTLSAFGTAAAASLSPRDTVYCLSPPSHPAGLLTSIGGAVAGGARFAMAEQFDPDTFWDEVRRYGVTVVSYTWSALNALVECPPRPEERHHPIRLFVGSGMRPGLWRRVVERFRTSGVVSFYTATDSDAVLVNLGGGGKAGALGRPLPGASDVCIASWDFEADAPRLDEAGWTRTCQTDEPGMLLAEADAHGAEIPPHALRGVLRSGDAWIVTGDVVRRDADGDIWWIDSLPQLIPGDSGARSPNTMGNILESIDAVCLAVGYGVTDDAGRTTAVAAVQLRADRVLDAADLDEAFAEAEGWAVPDVVRVVTTIPLTAVHRPIPGPLPAEGIPYSVDGLPVFERSARTGRFRLRREGNAAKSGRVG